MQKNIQLKLVAPLFLIAIAILASALFLLTADKAYAQSGGGAENPQRGSIGIEGLIPGDPPLRPPVINSPIDGQTITELPVTVRGTCEAGLIVEIYKNDVFAGSGVCKDNNTFSIDIDLFFGENVLYAGIRDLMGQRGPDSEKITVFYKPSVTGSDEGRGQQLLLTSPISFKGVLPGEEIVFPVQLSGGKGPYAISINWGDGNNDVFVRSDTGEFDISHVYQRPGVYRVIVKASDSNDQVAFLQLTAVVSGEPGSGTDDERPPPRVIVKYILWPLYVLTALLPVAYWLGVRYGKRSTQNGEWRMNSLRSKKNRVRE